MDSNVVRSKNFWTRKTFEPKIFLDPNFVEPKFFRTQIFFDLTIFGLVVFWNQNFFGLLNFLEQNIFSFWTKFFCLIQNILAPHIFYLMMGPTAPSSRLCVTNGRIYLKWDD